MTALLSTGDVARMLGVSEQRLAVMRLQGRSPRYCKIGRSVRFDPADVAAYIEATKRDRTSDVGEMAGAAA